MKFAIVALAAAATVSAELVFDDATGTFKCLGDAAGKNFCAGGSLTSNIIIRCSGEKGQPGNCNNNLAGVPPVGVKTSALCWQTSETSGDAGCSFQGIVHADDGSTFPIPGYSSSSSSTPEPTYGASTTAPGPTYGETTSSAPEPTYGVTTVTSSSYYPTLSWSNTTTTYYPPPTYTAPTSTLITVTGTTTVTTCDTTTSKPAPTSYAPPPPTNQTSYTSSLPTPTLTPNGAGALLAKDSLVLGVVALIGLMFL